MKQSFLSFFVFLCVSTFAGDVEIGLALLSEGKFDEACRYIHRAYKNNPDSQLAKFAYARTLSDGAEARNMYTSIVAGKSTSDSLKSKALCRLGCYYYCNEDYDSAQKAFTKAKKLVAANAIKHLKTMAILNTGDNRRAESLWLETVSRGKDSTAVKKARYYLGNAFCQQGKYEEAYNCYNTGLGTGKERWSVSALAGACLAAHHTGNSSRSTILYEQIRKEYPLLLEKNLLESIYAKPVSFSEEDISNEPDFSVVSKESPEPSPEREVEKQTVRYTLQVGAFGSAENAKKLQKKMKRDFGHVTVVKEMIKGKEFHKVRIGQFNNENEALDYGNKHLKGSGIAFRVVRE